MYSGRATVSPVEPLRFRHPKSFHVSPFMGMDAEYLWKFNVPSEHLTVGIESRRDDKPTFRAGMSLERREITNRQLTTTLLSYPVVTAKIVAAIYFEALRLWWKKCPYFPHPKNVRQFREVPDPRNLSRITQRTPQRQSLATRVSPQSRLRNALRSYSTRIAQDRYRERSGFESVRNDDG